MKRDQLIQLLQSIFRAGEQEMPCSEFFELLPRYVDVVLAGEDPAAHQLPHVAHHMAQCPECAEACEALLKVARSAE
jgi:hypothetical protein